MRDIQFTGKVTATLEVARSKAHSKPIVAWFPKLEMEDGNFVYLTRSKNEDALHAVNEEEALRLGKEYYDELMAIRSIQKEMTE